MVETSKGRKVYTVVPLIHNFIFHSFSYLWPIQFRNVKLCAVLSGFFGHPAQDMSHPFVQHLYTVDAPCPLVT